MSDRKEEKFFDILGKEIFHGDLCAIRGGRGYNSNDISMRFVRYNKEENKFYDSNNRITSNANKIKCYKIPSLEIIGDILDDEDDSEVMGNSPESEIYLNIDIKKIKRLSMSKLVPGKIYYRGNSLYYYWGNYRCIYMSYDWKEKLHRKEYIEDFKHSFSSILSKGNGEYYINPPSRYHSVKVSKTLHGEFTNYKSIEICNLGKINKEAKESSMKKKPWWGNKNRYTIIEKV